MLPLTLVKTGDLAKVIKVNGRDNVKKHLADLGFVDGTIVNVISSHDGDIILNVKDSRLAVTREMADKIMIELRKQYPECPENHIVDILAALVSAYSLKKSEKYTGKESKSHE